MRKAKNKICLSPLLILVMFVLWLVWLIADAANPINRIVVVNDMCDFLVPSPLTIKLKNKSSVVYEIPFSIPQRRGSITVVDFKGPFPDGEIEISGDLFPSARAELRPTQRNGRIAVVTLLQSCDSANSEDITLHCTFDRLLLHTPLDQR